MAADLAACCRAAPTDISDECLREWLAQLGLAEYLAQTLQWCDDMGATFLEEVAEHVKELAEALALSPEQTARAVGGARQALVTVLPNPAFCASDGQATGAVSLGRALTSSTTGSESGGEGRPKLCIARTMTLEASVQPFKLLLQNVTAASAPADSPESDKLQAVAEDEELRGFCPLGRTATCTVEGPLCGLVNSLPVLGDGRTFSITEMSRAGGHGFCNVAALNQEDASPTTRDAHHKQKLSRLDTVGVESEGGQNRASLVDKVRADATTPISINQGQTGNVFALEVGGEKVAVFKPVNGEQFSRRSLTTGKGAIREEAAYLVDRLCGSQAKVPVTSRAKIEVSGEELQGSVQAFVQDAIGFVEDFAMPRSVSSACEFVPQEAAEALALLDMRVFNMDRHSGNLLLLGKTRPHGLGPIDHGCCLPPWWRLSEAVFDAWIAWPQLLCKPCQETCSLVRTADRVLEKTCEMVATVGVEAAAIVTLRLCTLLVVVGVAELGVPVGLVASLMTRDEESGFQELSWLEEKILVCAQAAGSSCFRQVNDRGEQELQVDDGGKDLDVELFLQKLGEAFRVEVQEAAAKSRPGAPLEVKEPLRF